LEDYVPEWAGWLLFILLVITRGRRSLDYSNVIEECNQKIEELKMEIEELGENIDELEERIDELENNE
jgi:polyhydroxyalkanoate synthesis regulator phasin